MLGHVTNETEVDDYITKFLTSGPKNYGCFTHKEKVESKVGGFRLNNERKAKLNWRHAGERIKRNYTRPKCEIQSDNGFLLLAVFLTNIVLRVLKLFGSGCWKLLRATLIDVLVSLITRHCDIYACTQSCLFTVKTSHTHHWAIIKN